MTGDQLASAIRRYESGETLKAIAADLGRSRTHVSEQLTRAGVQLRLRRMTDTNIRQAIRLYEQGNSLAEVGKKVGFEASTIHRALKRAGVETRGTAGHPPQ